MVAFKYSLVPHLWDSTLLYMEVEEDGVGCSSLDAGTITLTLGFRAGTRHDAYSYS